MKLHEFMRDHRSEILEVALQKQAEAAPGRAREELAEGLSGYYDELVDALGPSAQTEETLRGSPRSADIGVLRLARGFNIGQVSSFFGSISDALGTIGTRYGASFAA